MKGHLGTWGPMVAMEGPWGPLGITLKGFPAFFWAPTLPDLNSELYPYKAYNSEFAAFQT